MTRRKRDQGIPEKARGDRDLTLEPLGASTGARTGSGWTLKTLSQIQYLPPRRGPDGHALCPYEHVLGVGRRRALCHPQGHLPRAGLAPLEGEEQRRTDQGGPRHARTETRRTQVTPNPKGIPPLQTGREGKGERGEGRDELPRARRVAGGPTP